MWSRVSKYFHTLRYLKLIQLRYQIYYRFMAKFSPFQFKLSTGNLKSSRIQFAAPFPVKNGSVSIDDGIVSFQFLNLSGAYPLERIRWNDEQHGKLWTYNLNYFDFLNQSDLSKDEGLLLIRKYIEDTPEIEDGFEPYPISLRCINWIKFLTNHDIEDEQIQRHLRGQYELLLKQIEYHLLANHLLENAFSLFFAAVYFRDKEFYNKSIRILEKQLVEQILEDGAHFELSPMYHQIILERLLDCINISYENSHIEATLLLKMKVYASKMLSWLEEITFENGDIPMVNDSAFGVAEPTSSLLKYAKDINLKKANISIGVSGYRKMKNECFELFIDAGRIGPVYQPGHAHADTFSYVLYYKGKPFIVDPGVSTYEIGKRRSEERSTLFHNTVSIEGRNSSEVWGGFRVAKRASVTLEEDNPSRVIAIHDGYKSITGVEVRRGWFLSSNSLIVEDDLANLKEREAISSLHFAPGIDLVFKGNSILAGGLRIDLEGHLKAEIKNYSFAKGFNLRMEAKKLEIIVRSKSKITFTSC